MGRIMGDRVTKEDGCTMKRLSRTAVSVSVSASAAKRVNTDNIWSIADSRVAGG